MTQGVRRLGLALVVASCALSSTVAAQDSAPAVQLEVPDCLGASGDDVKHLVTLELAPRLRVVSGEDAALIASVACTEPLVELEVRDRARAAPLRVELDLAAAAPLARPRLLALTLAELITTSQLEQPPPPPPPPAPPEAAPAESSEPDDPAADAARITLWVAPSVVLASELVTPLVGGDLGAAYALGRWLLALDVHARFGHNDRAASEARVRTLGAGLSVMPIVLDDVVRVSLGPVLHVGHASMSAASRSARLAALSFDGVWLAPAARIALQLPLAGPTALRCALEAGYYVRSVVGLDEAGDERLALRGPWLALSLGLALDVP